MARWSRGWGRRSRGRHALGAAVTELPSAPLARPVRTPPPWEPSLPVEPDPATEPGRLVESIAALLASGEAWAAPAAPPAVSAVTVPPVTLVPVDVLRPPPLAELPPPVTADHVDRLGAEPAKPAEPAAGPVVLPVEPWATSGPFLVPDAPVEPVPARAYDPLNDALLVPLEPGPAPLAAGLELDLDSLVLSGAATSVPSQPSGRVQLGFRDGSTASLAPDSEQAAALEELAQLLNRRD